jgi:hypothetical protein
MPSNYAQTNYQHDDPKIQKEFERVMRFINEIAESVEPLKEEEEQKKAGMKYLSVLHNDFPIAIKNVDVLNFIDSDKISYTIREEQITSDVYTDREPSYQVNITPEVDIKDCYQSILAQMQLLLARQSVPERLPIRESKETDIRVIKCDNVKDRITNIKSSDLVGAIQSMNFFPYPILPTTSSIIYNSQPYRALLFDNECYKYNMNAIDNTGGYTKIRVNKKGLYKVYCVFTGQYDNGNSMEEHMLPLSHTKGNTVTELLLMKNGIYNSTLNAMRVSNSSLHLQGADIIKCNIDDVISIGFKAYRQSMTNLSEVNLIWGEPTAPYIPLYSHLVVEYIGEVPNEINNSINTYSGEFA